MLKDYEALLVTGRINSIEWYYVRLHVNYNDNYFVYIY